MNVPDQQKLERVARRMADAVTNGSGVELSCEEALVALHVFKDYAQRAVKAAPTERKEGGYAPGCV